MKYYKQIMSGLIILVIGLIGLIIYYENKIQENNRKIDKIKQNEESLRIGISLLKKFN